MSERGECGCVSHNGRPVHVCETHRDRDGRAVLLAQQARIATLEAEVERLREAVAADRKATLASLRREADEIGGCTPGGRAGYLRRIAEELENRWEAESHAR